MTNLELTYSPYNLKLTKPFITSVGKISERKGFIISLKSNNNAEGIGEAAALPEFGSESYEEDESALKNIKLKLKLDLNNLIPAIEENLSEFNHLPALRSGIEQAILNLICVERKSTLSALLNKPTSRNISVNGIIGLINPEEVLKKVRELKSGGFRTIKVKAGREDFKEDLKILDIVRNETGKNFKIRMDVNGKWDTDQAIGNLEQLKKYDVEYVEQPVSRVEEFLRLSDASSIPLAADESIRSYKDAISIIENNLAPVLILKPMMLGGLITTLRIIEEAEKHDLKIVITSSLETSIGRSIAVFAAAIVKRQTAHGLAVADYFDDKIVSNPFPIKNGLINLEY